MVPGPSSGEKSVQTPRRARGGSVCIQPVSPSGEILHVRQEGQESRWDQCLRERVGLRAHVCIPTSSIDISDSGQDERAQRDPDPDYTILDQSGMASGVDSDVNEATPSSTSTAVHGERSQHRQGSTISEQAQVNSLDYLRETFQEQGADQTLAEFICGSWRGSTKSQYACAWRTWSEWCGGYAVPRTQPTVGQFANYLWFLYQVKRMAWSTIRLHRAAVATIIDPLTRNPLSQHPMICRFMKAVYLARPPAGKVKPIWSVAEVLQLLKSWGESETLSRPMLTEGEREENTQLLRTTVETFKPAGRQTIRAWLAKVLEHANIQAPGGSTRAASATWAAAKAVPISTIMAAADWSSVQTMSRYYIRPLPQGAPASEHLSVQRAVLGDF